MTISALFREQDGWALLGAKNSKCQTCTCVCNMGRPDAVGWNSKPNSHSSAILILAGGQTLAKCVVRM